LFETKDSKLIGNFVKNSTPQRLTTTSTDNNLLQSSRIFIPNIHLDDNFFAAGGNSLQAIRLLAIIREKFGCEITVKQFFNAKNLFEVTKIIKSARKETLLPKVKQVPLLPRYEASSAQKRLWILSKLYPSSPYYNVPYIFRIKGNFNKKKF